MKRSRLSHKGAKKRKHRVKIYDPNVAWAISVEPPKGRAEFTSKETDFIALGEEAVIEPNVIDLYFASKSEADDAKKRFGKRGFKVTNILREPY